MTARPNINEYCRMAPWVDSALLAGMKTPAIRNAMKATANSGTAMILQMVRSKSTNRVTMAQYHVSSLAAAYARLVSDDFPPMGEYVAYVIVASRRVLDDADASGIPYMCTLRSEGRARRTAEVLRVPRSLFADVEETNA